MKRELTRLRGRIAALGMAASILISQANAQTPPETVSGGLYLGNDGQYQMGLEIIGAVGSNYVVQSASTLSPSSEWKTLTNFALPSSPYLWLEPSGPCTDQRFYLVFQTNSVAPTNAETICFVTAGESFAAILSVEGNPAIEWTWDNASGTSTSSSPHVIFDGAALRTNTLTVTPWTALRAINVGYGRDDGGLPDIPLLDGQHVLSVANLQLASALTNFCGTSNSINSIDFHGLTNLTSIECFAAKIQHVDLHNLPSLNRLCLEQCEVYDLDLSECPQLGDLRAADNKNYTSINWGTTGSNVWHICTRSNPQITGSFPWSQFPRLIELWIWDDNQSGALTPAQTASLTSVLAFGNHFTSADFTGQSRMFHCDIQGSPLTNLVLTGCTSKGLTVNVNGNAMDANALDAVLEAVDANGNREGKLDLRGAQAGYPTEAGLDHVKALIAKDWKIELNEPSNSP